MNTFFYPNTAVHSHTTDNAVVGCMDFRLREARTAFMQSQDVEQYDNFVAPGATQELIEADGNGRTFLAIKVALDLHEGESLWLFQHTDCGAYGGSQSFDSLDAEIEFQSQQLHKAKEIIEKRCSEQNIAVPKINMHVEVIDTQKGGVEYRQVN